MARTVKPDEYDFKRREILDAAQRILLTKGYERMAIRDILDQLNISSGAFHHYFDSREALLEALVEHMQQQAEQPLLPLLHDPELSAPEKLQRFFDTLDRSRAAQKNFLIGLLRSWYTDENAIVRQKVDEAIIERRAPLLNVIIQQGIQEGVFATPYPGQVSSVIISLALGMGNNIARLLLIRVQGQNEPGDIDEIVATYAAYTEAIERALGASAPFLYRPDGKAVQGWLTP